MKNYRYKERRDRMIRNIGLWAGSVAGAVLLAYLLVSFCLQITAVHGESMEPAYYNNALVLTNKMAYRLHSPRRLDPVVIKLTNGSASHYSVKRVVGLPGEKILIEDGSLFVDGKELEGVFQEKILSPGVAAYTIELGEEEYFVMGDNCNNSEDSRVSNIGNISRDQFVGKVTMTVRKGHKN